MRHCFTFIFLDMSYSVSPNEEKAQTVLPSSNPAQQTVIIQQTEKKSNGLGVAGFVISLIGIFLCWIPILNFILWILGLLFSFIGLFKAPRGLAITGMVLSLILIIILVMFFGALLAAIGLSA